MKILLIFFFALITGCGQPVPPVTTVSAAHEKFLKICREEFTYPVVTREAGLPTGQAGGTFWIYLPLEEDIFDFKATAKGPQGSSRSVSTSSIQFLEVDFKNERFEIRYDISPGRKYDKDPGYTSGYTENFQRKQQNLLTAIFRAYGEVEPPDKAPEFFVLVMADIRKGLETATLFHFPDFKRAMLDQSFYEEFIRRTVSEEPKGHAKIVGDRQGRHLKFAAVTWPEFLSKQIQYRIRLKYQYSSFPPGPDAREEILQIAREVLDLYGFKDFQSILLEDLGTGEMVEVEKGH